MRGGPAGPQHSDMIGWSVAPSSRGAVPSAGLGPPPSASSAPPPYASRGPAQPDASGKDPLMLSARSMESALSFSWQLTMLEERMQLQMREHMAQIPRLIDERMKIYAQGGSGAAVAGARYAAAAYMGGAVSDTLPDDRDLGRRLEEQAAEQGRKQEALAEELKVVHAALVETSKLVFLMQHHTHDLPPGPSEEPSLPSGLMSFDQGQASGGSIGYTEFGGGARPDDRPSGYGPPIYPAGANEAGGGGQMGSGYDGHMFGTRPAASGDAALSQSQALGYSGRTGIPG